MQRPTQADVNNINAAIDVLIRREVEHSIDSITNGWPIVFFNYSVVAAFFDKQRMEKKMRNQGLDERDDN